MEVNNDFIYLKKVLLSQGLRFCFNTHRSQPGPMLQRLNHFGAQWPSKANAPDQRAWSPGGDWCYDWCDLAAMSRVLRRGETTLGLETTFRGPGVSLGLCEKSSKGFTPGFLSELQLLQLTLINCGHTIRSYLPVDPSARKGEPPDKGRSNHVETLKSLWTSVRGQCSGIFWSSNIWPIDLAS